MRDSVGHIPRCSAAVLPPEQLHQLGLFPYRSNRRRFCPRCECEKRLRHAEFFHYAPMVVAGCHRETKSRSIS